MSESDTDELLCQWSEPRRPNRSIHVKDLPQLSDLELVSLIENLETGHHQLGREITYLKARLQSETTVITQESEFKGQDETWFNEARTRELLQYARELRKSLERLLKQKEALEVECKEKENGETDSSSTTDNSE